jgi:hypothetical protein
MEGNLCIIVSKIYVAITRYFSSICNPYLHIQQRIFDFKAKISIFLLKVATTIMNGHQRFLPGKL